jgi:hypothetical protein
MTARIGFQLEITAMPGFHSQYDWCFHIMLQFAGVPEDPEDNTVMEKHGAEALYSTVMCLMHAIRTSDKHGQQDAALRMIQITKPWTIRKRSESKLAKEKPHDPLLKQNAHLVVLEWTEDDQIQLKTHVEIYTAWGASEVWSDHSWQLTCY